MDPQNLYFEIISGERRGPAALGVRAALRVLSWGYRAVMRVRNAWYDRFSLPTWLEVPVVSVGNLTVGGTGKTPMAIWLCRHFLERGLKPAVLSRGYKAAEAAGADELLIVSRQCPQAVAVANPDRAAAGGLAVEQYGAKVAILDDGFQHRRLGRDLDLVLIDATRPFGFGYCLPRGLLREPPRSLYRADAVIITRCDQCDPPALDAIIREVRGHHPHVPVARSIHRPIGFTDIAGAPIASPTHGRIGAFAGIARPDPFLRTLADVNVHAADARWWPDHHAYEPTDLALIADWVRDARLVALVTTEKDAVKLARLDGDWPVPVHVLAIEIAMLDDGDTILSGLIDRMLAEHEEPHDRDERPAAGAESADRPVAPPPALDP